jgi:hypothetical protein
MFSFFKEEVLESPSSFTQFSHDERIYTMSQRSVRRSVFHLLAEKTQFVISRRENDSEIIVGKIYGNMDFADNDSLEEDTFYHEDDIGETSVLASAIAQVIMDDNSKIRRWVSPVFTTLDEYRSYDDEVTVGLFETLSNHPENGSTFFVQQHESLENPLVSYVEVNKAKRRIVRE